MQKLTLPGDLLADPRLDVLRSEMGMSLAEAVGTLVIFWARTRRHKTSRIPGDSIGVCLPCAVELRNRLLGALQSAGYITFERESDPSASTFCSGHYLVVDNASAERIRAVRSLAGQASAKKRAVKKPARKTKQAELSTALVATDPPSRDANVACFEAYSAAYFKRYGTRPPADASVRGMVSNLVKRVGAREAPLLAAWYLTHPDGYFVKNTHRFSLLLQGWETLLTQFRRDTYVTNADVKNYENAQKQVSQRDRIRNTMFKEQ